MIGKLEVVPGEGELARRVADGFVEAAREAIQRRGVFEVSLAGGSTPKAAFDLLAAAPLRERTEWKRIRFFFGDERCVGPDDPESNYRMAREHLFEPLAIAPETIFRIRGEDPPQEAADAYERLLRATLGELPVFDLLMLGMGPEGHTASLFPGTLGQIDPSRLVATTWIEKFGVHRITLTPRTINAARAIVVAAGGESKADALAQVLEGPRNPDLYPSQVLNPASGTLTWIVDREAAKRLAAYASS
jgi:6-phosphogluconolactonase